MGAQAAIDFDDTLCATNAAIISAFLNRGFYIPPHIHRYSDWNGEAPFTEAVSREIVLSVTANVQLAPRLPPVQGAIQGIFELIALGWDITILTARSEAEGEVAAARCFLEEHGLGHLPIVGTALQSKAGFLNGARFILDDSFNELHRIPPGVRRLLFAQPSNERYRSNLPSGIELIQNWPHAVKVVRDIDRGN